MECVRVEPEGGRPSPASRRDAPPPRRHTAARPPARRRVLPVIRALLDAGATVDAEGPDGWSALRVAAVSGNLPVVEELLARGADVHRRDDEGRTTLSLVLDRAAQQGGAAPPAHVQMVIDTLKKASGAELVVVERAHP